jgi:hypothetical protein
MAADFQFLRNDIFWTRTESGWVGTMALGTEQLYCSIFGEFNPAALFGEKILALHEKETDRLKDRGRCTGCRAGRKSLNPFF